MSDYYPYTMVFHWDLIVSKIAEFYTSITRNINFLNSCTISKAKNCQFLLTKSIALEKNLLNFHFSNFLFSFSITIKLFWVAFTKSEQHSATHRSKKLARTFPKTYVINSRRLMFWFWRSKILGQGRSYSKWKYQQTADSKK